MCEELLLLLLLTISHVLFVYLPCVGEQKEKCDSTTEPSFSYPLIGPEFHDQPRRI